MTEDYKKAKELGLIKKDRWEKGIPHHPMSERIIKFMSNVDSEEYDLYLDIKYGGDGDIGEYMMYILDDFFEMQDKLK